MLRRLTIERTSVVILFLLVFALAARVPVDTDTWWHLRSGETTLTEGMIHADSFSHTRAGEPWINHSWGAQIVLYAFWQIGGMTGLVVYMAGLATAGMILIFLMCQGSAYLRAFAIILGAAAAAVFWSPRPQMLSFFLSAAALYLLFLYKYRNVDRLWLYPPLMALWGNLHAGFAIGIIFLTAVVGGEILGRLLNPSASRIPWKGIGRLLLIGVVSAAALVINPYGLDILSVPFQTIGIGALRSFIQEWNSPNFQGRETWPFIFLLLAVLGAAGISRRRMDWTEFFLVGGTAFMGLLAGRNIAVFAVAATPILTFYLNDFLEERGWSLKPVRRVTPRMAALNTALIIVIAFAALVKTASVVLPRMVDEAMRLSLPLEAVEYIQATTPPGPLFNSYNWGGYLVYALRDYPVYVDGRTDLYGDEILSRYLTIATAGDSWREWIDEAGIRLVLIETESGLARRLREEPGWRAAYADDFASVFTRES
ncbi:MAG: hypothetical protein L6Q98_10790 [Anaerolineae bacterium]|nr:hypothetical protein [Anaerolineae bacterium]NUQ02687.1 hypothetical protein [Anaerolineae bacterium]